MQSHLNRHLLYRSTPIHKDNLKEGGYGWLEFSVSSNIYELTRRVTDMYCSSCFVNLEENYGRYVVQFISCFRVQWSEVHIVLCLLWRELWQICSTNHITLCLLRRELCRYVVQLISPFHLLRRELGQICSAVHITLCLLRRACGRYAMQFVSRFAYFDPVADMWYSSYCAFAYSEEICRTTGLIFVKVYLFCP